MEPADLIPPAEQHFFLLRLRSVQAGQPRDSGLTAEEYEAYKRQGQKLPQEIKRPVKTYLVHLRRMVGFMDTLLYKMVQVVMEESKELQNCHLELPDYLRNQRAAVLAPELFPYPAEGAPTCTDRQAPLPRPTVPVDLKIWCETWEYLPTDDE